MEDPYALLLLPRTLEQFILRELAQDLLRAERVLAVEPPPLRYGALGRIPEGLAAIVAGVQARRLAVPGPVRAILMFHPLQFPLAEALLDRHREAELWYSRWDRFECAYDASPRLRRRLEALHENAARRAAHVFAVSDALVAIEREAGRDATLAPPAHDSFPAPDPEGAVIAVSLGHLGWRTDWRLLRELAERMPELVLLLIGELHPDECPSDEDLAACRQLPNLIWLGRRSDEEAARLVMCADVGILPFRREPFNDAGLPQRIVKYARLGRRTIAPELAGVLTWERAVTRAAGVEEWMRALRASAGARSRPDAELRRWALAQTALRQNGPLWDRLEELGIARRPAI